MGVYFIVVNVYAIDSMYFGCYKVTDASQISLLQCENQLGTKPFTFQRKARIARSS